MKFVSSYLFLILTLVGIHLGGPWVWLGFALLVLAVPVIEHLFGQSNDPTEHENGGFFDFLMVVRVPALCLFLVDGFAVIPNYQGVEFIGAVLSFGYWMGINTNNVGHELFHRADTKLRWLGYLSVLIINFGHWAVSHVSSHHKWAATPNDPGTAKRGEMIYTFFLRSLFGGMREALKFEHSRLKNKSLMSRLFSNRVIGFSFVSIGASVCIWNFLGAQSLLFWWAQSAVAISVILGVDYVQHYGLQRAETGPNTFEAFRSEHAWDSPHNATNIVIWNAGYHSSHHQKPQIPYQDLPGRAGPLRMPFGLMTMYIIALAPPIWMNLTDKILNQKNPSQNRKAG